MKNIEKVQSEANDIKKKSRVLHRGHKTVKEV